jgi:hypothetical protein
VEVLKRFQASDASFGRRTREAFQQAFEQSFRAVLAIKYDVKLVVESCFTVLNAELAHN